MGKRWSGHRGAVVPVVAGVSMVLVLAGCSGDGTADPGPSSASTSSGGTALTEQPREAPSTAASPSSTAPVPAPTGSAAPAPAAPAPAEPTPPPGLTEAPRIPPEQSDAAGGFTACAQRYQERIQTIMLGGAVTPLLLEQWAQTYEAASASAAEGDPVAAEQACLALQREMDAVLS